MVNSMHAYIDHPKNNCDYPNVLEIVTQSLVLGL
jgi:hypothetical protein